MKVEDEKKGELAAIAYPFTNSTRLYKMVWRRNGFDYTNSGEWRGVAPFFGLLLVVNWWP